MCMKLKAYLSKCPRLGGLKRNGSNTNGGIVHFWGGKHIVTECGDGYRTQKFSKWINLIMCELCLNKDAFFKKAGL